MAAASSTAATRDGRGAAVPEPEPEPEGLLSPGRNAAVAGRAGLQAARSARVGLRPHVTDDGNYLIITVWKGTDDKYRIFYRDLSEPYAMPVELIDSFENEYAFLANDGPVFLQDRPRRAAQADHRDRHSQAGEGRTGARSCRRRPSRLQGVDVRRQPVRLRVPQGRGDAGEDVLDVGRVRPRRRVSPASVPPTASTASGPTPKPLYTFSSFATRRRSTATT